MQFIFKVHEISALSPEEENRFAAGRLSGFLEFLNISFSLFSRGIDDMREESEDADSGSVLASFLELIFIGELLDVRDDSEFFEFFQGDGNNAGGVTRAVIGFNSGFSLGSGREDFDGGVALDAKSRS